MKDEAKSNIITQFIGLQAKAYSMKIQDSEEKRAGKGVVKPVLKNA